MRAVVVMAMLVLVGTASAQPLRHRDPEVLRPELKSVTVTSYETTSGKRVETGRELRTYDKAGQVLVVEHRRAGKMIVRWDYTWSKGQIAKRAYREPKGRREVRTFTYKLDKQKRVIEKTMRDPAATNGEHYVTTTTWKADGSRDEETYRHYAKEGPYRDTTESYAANGQLETHCSTTPHCEMIEYDARGHISRIRQQMGAEHDYLVYTNTYDASGRLEKQKLGSTETTFVYNADNLVIEETTSSGRTSVYTYVTR